jgi:hypothetical protein
VEEESPAPAEIKAEGEVPAEAPKEEVTEEAPATEENAVEDL